MTAETILRLGQGRLLPITREAIFRSDQSCSKAKGQDRPKPHLNLRGDAVDMDIMDSLDVIG